MDFLLIVCSEKAEACLRKAVNRGSVWLLNVVSSAVQETCLLKVGVCNINISSWDCCPRLWRSNQRMPECDFLILTQTFNVDQMQSSDSAEGLGLSSSGNAYIWVRWIPLKCIPMCSSKFWDSQVLTSISCCHVKDNNNLPHPNGAVKLCFTFTGSIPVCKY